MEPALPEETVTKNDVQKASSERVGPMDDVLDSEVPVEIVQKQSLLRKRLPAKTADAGTMEEIALGFCEGAWDHASGRPRGFTAEEVSAHLGTDD